MSVDQKSAQLATCLAVVLHCHFVLMVCALQLSLRFFLDFLNN